jgi:hypothetical protein
MSTAGPTTLHTTFTPTDATDYNTATASVTLTVVTVLPSFTVSGSAVTLTAGATSANTSTITVTPANGFTGAVTLTASVTASPANAQHTPTLAFTTNPVTISSATAATTTLTITSTASTSSCVAANEAPPGLPWYTRGGAVLACLLLFGIAPKRRKIRAMLGMVLLFAALAGGMMACGGSGSKACTNVVTPGTTAGSYTITLNGASGSTTAPSATFTLTVQ